MSSCISNDLIKCATFRVDFFKAAENAFFFQFFDLEEMQVLSVITCLQPTLEDIGRNGDHPVKDAGHASGEERSTDAELGAIAALGRQRPLNDLVAAKVSGARGNIYEKKYRRLYLKLSFFTRLRCKKNIFFPFFIGEFGGFVHLYLTVFGLLEIYTPNTVR